MSLKERLERLELLEASHVRLMTEREVEDRKNDRAWRRHRRFVRDQEKAWERQRERAAATDERIDRLGERIEQLVSGIGAFMRKSPEQRQ